MALIFNAPLTATFSDFDAAQANGSTVDPRGLVAPIPGRIEITAAPDGFPAFMSRITPSDALTYGGIRSEIDYAPEANAERWYVWDVYMESSFPSADLLTFMQVHDSPDAGESVVKYPTFELQVYQGYVHCTVPINCPDESSPAGRYPPQRRRRLVTDRWVTCCLHTNWATDSTGFLEVYYDNELLAKEWHRACGYADSVGGYWKLGLYDFNHLGLSGEARAWYRNAALYSGGQSMQAVLGLTPRPTQLTQALA